MKKYQIITDGSCDLSDEYIIANDLIVVPFYVSFKDGIYLKEKQDVKIRDFYQQMIDNSNVYPKSSMPSTNDYYEIFERLVKADMPIICMCITTKFSGSYNSAMTAQNMILEEYPTATITIIDTIVNTVLQGLMVKEAVRMQNNDVSYEKVIANIEKIKPTGRIFFTVNGLDYLHHGGRIGKVAAIIGNVLKINPLITLKEGEIFSSGMALSRKRALVKVREMFIEHFKKINQKLSDYRIVIGYGYNIEEAVEFKEKICELYSLAKEDVDFEQIGATISVHTGPYPLGIGLIKKYNV